MRCRACAGLRQLGLNAALFADLAGNTLLAGNPRETISMRTARARHAGHRWAAVACRALTWIGAKLGSTVGDHCTWALDDSSGSIAAEVWHWSQPIPVVTPGSTPTQPGA